VGQGRSKKEARNASAKRLIEQLDLSTLPQVSWMVSVSSQFICNMFQKPQRHPGGRQVKRKMSNDGNDEGSTDPRIKKNRGRMSNMHGMIGDGMSNPMLNSGNFFGQQIGSKGFLDMGSIPGMGMGPMMGMGGYHGGMNFRQRNFRPNISVEDRHVMEKHQEVYPDQEELDTILMLVDITEKALTRVSDKFIAEQESEERELMGVARVGDLAKGLLLKGDKEVMLVVLCAKKPNLVILEKITSALKKELQVEDGQEEAMSKYEMHMFPEEGGLYVTSNEVWGMKKD
jgi:hypothetical protein